MCDDCIGSDYDCFENHGFGGFYTDVEIEKRFARVISKPLPGGTFTDNLSFYLSPGIRKLKYNLVMYAIEEHAPTVYKVLTSLGLPEPTKRFS